MSRGILIIVLVLALAGGGAWYVWGQKDDTTATVSAEPAESPESGTPAAAPAAGRTPETAPQAQDSGKKMEAWTKRCNEKEKYCEIFQRLVVKENNLRLIELAVGYPKDTDSAQAVIVLPLGVIVSEGIVLKVDEAGTPSKAMIRSCNQEGCYVVMNLPASFIDSMKTGKQLIVSFLDGTGKQLNIGVSLPGFAEKLTEVAP